MGRRVERDVDLKIRLAFGSLTLSVLAIVYANSAENIEAVIKLGEANQAMTEQFAGYMRSQIPPFFEHHPSFESLEAWINRHPMLTVAHLMIGKKLWRG